MKSIKPGRGPSIGLRFLILSVLFLALLMCSAEAANEVVSGQCGLNATYKLEDNGVLTITGSGKIDGYPWKVDAYRGQVKEVIIYCSNCVIGKEAFQGCEALEQAYAPNVLEIEEGAFSYCSNLTGLALAISNDSLVIGDYAFYGCAKLQGLGYRNASSIGKQAYYGCKALTSFIIDSLGILGEQAFYDCSGLEMVDIPGGILEIKEGTFFNCGSLKSVTLPNTVRSIGHMAFGNCTGLKSIRLPDQITEVAAEAFSGCPAVLYAEIGSDAAKALGKINTSFRVFNNGSYEMKYLWSENAIADLQLVSIDADVQWVKIPEGVTLIGASVCDQNSYVASVVIPTTVKRINEFAFAACNVGNITIPANVTYFEQAIFSKCKKLDSAILSCNAERLSDGMFFECSNLRTVIFERAVAIIGKEAFSGCASLKTIALLPGLKTIETCAFANCDNLNEISLPATLTTIEDSAFAGTTNHIETVTYAGTISDRAKISFGKENESLLYAKWKCADGEVTGPIGAPTTNPPADPTPAPADPTSPPAETTPPPAPPVAIDIAFATVSAIRDQVFTGSEIKPAVTVSYGGSVLVQGTHYTLAYSNNRLIGKATVTVSGIGDYFGVKYAPFNILPRAVKISSLKAGKKMLTVKWGRGLGIDGYEIQYGLKKDFKGAKKLTVTREKTTSAELKKLKSKKTYYVRIRAFKKVKGRKYYSDWSKTLKKKVK